MTTIIKDASSRLEALETRISHFLRWGVVLAGVLLLAGWVGMIQTGSHSFADFANYHPESFTRQVGTAWERREFSILAADAGLIALISLPILRVLMTSWLFFKSRDRVLAATAFFVLLTLLISLCLGLEA